MPQPDEQSTPLKVDVTSDKRPTSPSVAENFSTPKEVSCNEQNRVTGDEQAEKISASDANRAALKERGDAAPSSQAVNISLLQFPEPNPAIVNWSLGLYGAEWGKDDLELLNVRLTQIFETVARVMDWRDSRQPEVFPQSTKSQTNSLGGPLQTTKRSCVLAHSGYSESLVEPTAKCSNEVLFKQQTTEIKEEAAKLEKRPYTLQRLAEILVNPKCYPNPWKLLRALYKVIALAEFPVIMSKLGAKHQSTLALNVAAFRSTPSRSEDQTLSTASGAHTTDSSPCTPSRR